MFEALLTLTPSIIALWLPAALVLALRARAMTKPWSRSQIAGLTAGGIILAAIALYVTNSVTNGPWWPSWDVFLGLATIVTAPATLVGLGALRRSARGVGSSTGRLLIAVGAALIVSAAILGLAVLMAERLFGPIAPMPGA